MLKRKIHVHQCHGHTAKVHIKNGKGHPSQPWQDSNKYLTVFYNYSVLHHCTISVSISSLQHLQQLFRPYFWGSATRSTSSFFTVWYFRDFENDFAHLCSILVPSMVHMCNGHVDEEAQSKLLVFWWKLGFRRCLRTTSVPAFCDINKLNICSTCTAIKESCLKWK